MLIARYIWKSTVLVVGTLLGTVSVLHSQDSSLQELSLSEAYTLLEERYPILQNGEIWLQILQQQQAQLEAEYKPGLYWKTDARLQSESVQLSSPEGNFPIEINQPLVNAQTYLEGSYLLLDGGSREARQAVLEAETAVQLQNVEVDRYQLQEQVNRLFLRLSSLRAQADLFELSLTDIKTRIEQAQAGVDNGILLESELAKLQVRQKELLAQESNIDHQIQGSRKSLEDLLDISLMQDVKLIYPAMDTPLQIPSINRPEQKLFQQQRTAILAQETLIEVEKRPTLNLFAQAGVGYPNPLNLLDSDPAPFALVGAGLSWKLIDWNKSKRQKEELSLRALQVQNQQATFEFNLQQQEASYRAEVQRLQQQMEYDREIVALQGEILAQSAAQLEEGVITTTEYISQSTAELQARQQLSIHEVELLSIQLNFWNTRGAGRK
ncbi:MAG: TolC family protein [Bacteroidota bacterium]